MNIMKTRYSFLQEMEDFEFQMLIDVTHVTRKSPWKEYHLMITCFNLFSEYGSYNTFYHTMHGKRYITLSEISGQ